MDSTGVQLASRARLVASRLARWILVPVGTILAASFVLYAALSLAPGDPVYQLLGGRGTQEQYAALRAELGLDQPFLIRYWDWLTSAIHGDFGRSFTYKQSVASLIEPRLGITLSLAMYAGLLIVVVGVGLGVLGGATRRAGAPVAAVSGLGIAIPAFVAAQLLIAVFAVRLGWFPVLGAGEAGVDRLRHLTLPAIALAIGYAAYVAQVTRAAVSEERASTHVETARGRGLSRTWVFRRHVLRNAAIPITTVSALAVAGLFAGAVVVEYAFGLGGLGSLLVQSVSARDYNVVLAISLILLVVFVLATTLIDLVQWLLDPRQRTARQGQMSANAVAASAYDGGRRWAGRLRGSDPLIVAAGTVILVRRADGHLGAAPDAVRPC